MCFSASKSKQRLACILTCYSLITFKYSIKEYVSMYIKKEFILLSVSNIFVLEKNNGNLIVQQ